MNVSNLIWRPQHSLKQKLWIQILKPVYGSSINELRVFDHKFELPVLIRSHISSQVGQILSLWTKFRRGPVDEKLELAKQSLSFHWNWNDLVLVLDKVFCVRRSDGIVIFPTMCD